MMTMLYLFLSLFASHVFMVVPLLIRKEQAENKETFPSSEANKTATEGTDQKPHLFLSMFLSKITKENSHHGQVISSPSVQAKLSPDANINVRIKGSKADKTKRAAKNVDGCRREDMIVNSTELGLPTKFIRPKSFNAYQCKGICSLQQRGKYIIHSLMKDHLEEKKGIKADSDACCVPTKLRPMTVIYHVENVGFVVRTFDNMIVEECGCY